MASCRHQVGLASGDLVWIRSPSFDDHTAVGDWHIRKDIGPALVLDVDETETYVKYVHNGVTATSPSIYFVKVSTNS